MTDPNPEKPTRSQRKAERLERQKQVEQRYRKARQRNVMAQPGRFPMVFVLDNLKAGFNVPKIFRSMLAFGGSAVHLINIGVFDPAPAKGAFRKVPARFHTHFSEAFDALQEDDYQVFALTADGDTMLGNSALPEKSAFVVGHEEQGLSFDPADYPGIQTLGVPLYGEMESLNASVAASVVMYEYTRQHAQ